MVSNFLGNLYSEHTQYTIVARSGDNVEIINQFDVAEDFIVKEKPWARETYTSYLRISLW